MNRSIDGSKKYLTTPDLPWVLTMDWHDVLFLHWPVTVEMLEPHVPDRLTIETFDGTAWLGIVPFYMSGIRPRICPSVPFISNFPELNIRTYVNDGTVSGVWFHSLDASSWLSVHMARLTYSLNYYHAEMDVQSTNGTIHYQSKRKAAEPGEFIFKGSYTPVERKLKNNGPLEKFLTERYYLFSSDDADTIYRGAIDHDPWPLQPANYQIDHLSIDGHPVPGDNPPASVLYAPHLSVNAWLPRKISSQ